MSDEDQFTRSILHLAIAHLVREAAHAVGVEVTGTEARCLDVLVHLTDLFLRKLARHTRAWAELAGRRQPSVLDAAVGLAGLLPGPAGGGRRVDELDGSEGFAPTGLAPLLRYCQEHGSQGFPRLPPGTYPVPVALVEGGGAQGSPTVGGDDAVPAPTTGPTSTSTAKRKSSARVADSPPPTPSATGGKSAGGRRRRLEKFLYPAENASEDFVLMPLPSLTELDQPMQLDRPAPGGEDPYGDAVLLEQALTSAKPEAIPLLPLEKSLQILDAAEHILARTGATTTSTAAADKDMPICQMVDAAMPWIPELMGSVVQSRARAFPGIQPKRKKDREMRKLMMAKLADNGGAGAREVLESIVEQEGTGGMEAEDGGEGDDDDEEEEERAPEDQEGAPPPAAQAAPTLPGIRLSIRLPAGPGGASEGAA